MSIESPTEFFEQSWEEKYLELYKKYKNLKNKIKNLNVDENFDCLASPGKLAERRNSLEMLRNECERYENIIKDLKEKLTSTEKDLSCAENALKFERERITTLKKFRQHSVHKIEDLEAEIEASKKQIQTPKYEKIKDRKVIAFEVPDFSINTISIEKIFPKKTISEDTTVIENLNDLVGKEVKKNIELTKALKNLQNDKKELTDRIRELGVEKSDFEKKFKSFKMITQEKIQHFTKKIESLQAENHDLKQKIKYFDKGSDIDASSFDASSFDHEEVPDELAELSDTQKPIKLFERSQSYHIMNGAALYFKSDSSQTFNEMLQKISCLEKALKETEIENIKLSDKLEKHSRHSQKLNAILVDNQKKFLQLKSQLNLKPLIDEKNRLELEISKKRIILNGIQVRPPLKKNVNHKTAYEDKKTEKSPADYSGNENFKQIKNRIKFPEDCKRKRSMGSWGYDLMASNFNNN